MTSNMGPEVIKLFSYSAQLSMKFFLLINIKMPTVVGILIFISMKIFHAELYSAGKNVKIIGILIFMSGINFMLN